MKFCYQLLALLAISTASLQATGIVLCYDKVGTNTENQRFTPCASQANFSVLPHNDIVDWGLPTGGGGAYGLGSADSNFNAFRSFTPGDAGGGNFTTWNARSTGDLITAGLTRTPDDFDGTSAKLQRYDNGSVYNPANVSIFDGHFSIAGSPYGDHLVGFDSARGPLLINFDQNITSVGFYISSKALSNFGATVKAYDHINPLSTDIPILTYRIATDGAGGGGSCATVSDDPQVACNDAPFVGLDGNNLSLLGSPQTFRSIVISSTDSAGFLIDSLYLGADLVVASEVPEPASTLMIGGGMILLGLAARKARSRA